MRYIAPNGDYPRHYGDIQLAHSGWQLGDALPEAWVEVADTPLPTIADDEIIFEGTPAEVDGVMAQTWEVRKMTAEEIERKNAPQTVKAKLVALGLNEAEIEALSRGLVR